MMVHNQVSEQVRGERGRGHCRARFQTSMRCCQQWMLSDSSWQQVASGAVLPVRHPNPAIQPEC